MNLLLNRNISTEQAKIFHFFAVPVMQRHKMSTCLWYNNVRNTKTGTNHERNKTMWKKLINLVTKNVKKNETAHPVRQLRPVEQYVQLSLPLD